MREARPRRTLSITQLVVLLSAGATIIALSNLLVDVLQMLIDPRIRRA